MKGSAANSAASLTDLFFSNASISVNVQHVCFGLCIHDMFIPSVVLLYMGPSLYGLDDVVASTFRCITS